MESQVILSPHPILSLKLLQINFGIWKMPFIILNNIFIYETVLQIIDTKEIWKKKVVSILVAKTVPADGLVY